MTKIYAIDCYYEITYTNELSTLIPLGLIFQVDRDDSNKEYYARKIKGERNKFDLSNPALLQYVLTEINKINSNLLALPIKHIFEVNTAMEIDINKLSSANIRNIISSLISDEDKVLLTKEIIKKEKGE